MPSGYALLKKNSILFDFITEKLGFRDFKDVKYYLDEIELSCEKIVEDGNTVFYKTLIMNQRGNRELLEKYDTNIMYYIQKLSARENFKLKYFQYLALLYTEYYLDNYSNYKERFIIELNEYSAQRQNNRDENKRYNLDFRYGLEDLNKLAFWMATGSGKTLIMHINYYQVLKYLKDYNSILLVTPSEKMSNQHYKEMVASGIPCKKYEGNTDRIFDFTSANEVFIIDINKLTENKTGGGISLDIAVFETGNIVFIDEGHKGQSSDEQAWKRRREAIAENGFIFEYSATFGQIISEEIKVKNPFEENGIKYNVSRKYNDVTVEAKQNRTVIYNKNTFYISNIEQFLSLNVNFRRSYENLPPYLLEEYGKCIVFDYSYKHFYLDSYGKDYDILNIDTNQYNPATSTNFILTAGLLSFFQQIFSYAKNMNKAQIYNIEKPLWALVGSKVSGRGTNSDLLTMLKYFYDILNNREHLTEYIRFLFSDQFENNNKIRSKFEYLLRSYRLPNDIDNLVGDIYLSIFNGIGNLRIFQIKNSDNEIALCSGDNSFFGLIDIGDVGEFKKLAEANQLIFEEQSFTESLFGSLNNRDNTINILMGAKRFIEGWDSFRVGTMGLMEVGQGEGTQIIQLFGRGVRFKGKNYSLKREGAPSDWLAPLQTCSIFGLKADYLSRFLESLGNEDLKEKKSIDIPIQYNNKEKWNNNLYTIEFEHIKLFDKHKTIEIDKNIKIEINLLSNIKVSGNITDGIENKFSLTTVQLSANDKSQILREYIEFYNWDRIYTEVIEYKIMIGAFNILINKEILKDIIEQESIYKIYAHDNDIKPRNYNDILNLENIVLEILTKYIKYFSNAHNKETLNNDIKINKISDSHPDLLNEYDKNIKISIPAEQTKLLSNIINDMNRMYNEDTNNCPTIHFDKHLYSPIISHAYNDISSNPPKLNEGETKFVFDLREFIQEDKNNIKNFEIFLLRNLSKVGIGFFHYHGFYPDFIMWVKKGNIQSINFIEPKGMMLGQDLTKSKLEFCKNIKRVERACKKELSSQQWGKDNEDIFINAFFVSVTEFQDVIRYYKDYGDSIEEMAQNGIFYQNNDRDYIRKIFNRIMKEIN